ncbi:putative NUP-1 protein, partial [Trypanosoma theileri]
MFSTNDARRYPGFFTRTWTPPPEGIGNRSNNIVFTHGTTPPLTPRLVTPISVRGLAATDPLGRLTHSMPTAADVQANRALVGISREEPNISPHISTLDVNASARIKDTQRCRSGWDDMTPEERMDYTARLESDMSNVKNTLDRAYHLRDHYKEEAARLRGEVMQKQALFDRLERDHRKCSEVIRSHQLEVQELRRQLDLSEGEVYRLKQVLQSKGENEFFSPMDYERRFSQNETEMARLQEENRSLENQIQNLREELKAKSSLTVQKTTKSVQVDILDESLQKMGQYEEKEEQLAQSQHLIQVLRAEMQDLRQQLQKERLDNESSLNELITQRNSTQSINTSLREEKEALDDLCRRQNKEIQELREDLLQRAPVSHQDYHALTKRYEELKEEIEHLKEKHDNSLDIALELEKQTLQQQLFNLRHEGEEKERLLQNSLKDASRLRELNENFQKELELSRMTKELLEKELSKTKKELQSTEQSNREAENIIEDLNKRVSTQLSTINQLTDRLNYIQHTTHQVKNYDEEQQSTQGIYGTTTSATTEIRTDTEIMSQKTTQTTIVKHPTKQTKVTESIQKSTDAKAVTEEQTQIPTSTAITEDITRLQMELQNACNTRKDLEIENADLRERLSAAMASIDQLAEERNVQAAKVAELTDAVSRLESTADAP